LAICVILIAPFEIYSTCHKMARMSDEIVGAFIGVGGAVIGTALGFGLTYFTDKSKSKKRRKNLMGALVVELGNLEHTVGEMHTDVIVNRGICLKSFDYDVLSSSRVTLAEYEDKYFLSLVAQTYTDVILTNGLLGKLVRAWEEDRECERRGDPVGKKPREMIVRPTTESAIDNTQQSIAALKKAVEGKYAAL